ncbi:MAG: hypothetical protein ABEJ81_06215 [Haloferacaceae archaeon]
MAPRPDGRPPGNAGADPDAERTSDRLVGWTETRVEAPVPAGQPGETGYYVAVTVADPAEPFLTVGRVPPLARLRRWLAARLGLGARVVPDRYVPAPAAVERIVAERIAAGMDPSAVARRADDERELIAAARFDDEVAARNRALPVGRCLVATAADGDGFEVGYGWFEPFR